MKVIRHWKRLLAQSTYFEVLKTQLDKVLINLMELGLLSAEGWDSLPLEVSSKTNFSLISSPYVKSFEASTSCLKSQPLRNRRNPKLVIPVLEEWDESGTVWHYPEWQLASPCLFSCNPILQRHFKHTGLPRIFLHNGPCPSALWISGWKSVANAQMLRLWLNSPCTASRLFLFPALPCFLTPLANKLRVIYLGQLRQTGKRGIPISYNIVLSSKSCGKGGRRGDRHGYGVCLLKQLLTCTETLLSRKLQISSLLMGSSGWSPLLFVHPPFAFFIKL